MASKVFLIRTGLSEKPETAAKKAAKLFQHANLSTVIAKDDLVAVKLHFGEKGNDGYVRPYFLKALVSELKKAGGKPFLTDTNTLYVGQRSNSVDHCHVAHEHGFSIESVGAPIIITDGLLGNNCIRVPIKGGKHFKEVQIATDIVHAHSMLVVTHATGHLASGFGGCLKNIGMGTANRGGKLQQHSDVKPHIESSKCTSCGTCVKWCPADAISLPEEPSGKKKGTAQIDAVKCIGCGECLAVCRFKAVKFSWGETSEHLQQKMAEYAAGALASKNGKAAFMNFLMKFTPNCDCMGKDEKPVLEDIGILASLDPVAVDRASVDLLNQAHGTNIFKELWPQSDINVQIEHAEKLGLGSQKYSLEEVQ